MAFSAQDLTFDPETHTSVRSDGLAVPHVTKILSAVGVSTDFESLAMISRRRALDIEYRRNLGSALHVDAHAYDDDDLDWSTVHPDVRPYLDAWAECREALGLLPLERERQLYQPTFVYTGIMDGVFTLRHAPKKRILGDLKIGDPDDAAAHLQTAAYESAYLAQHQTGKIDERWAIQLTPGARVPYIITNYSARQDAWKDFQIFLACLTVYHQQPSRRPRDF